MEGTYRRFYEEKHKECTKYFELYVPLMINQYLGAHKILDLGSGQQVRNNGTDKILVTYSDISIKAMKVAKNERPTSDFIVLDAQRLPFRSGAFDSVLCKDILEHLPNDKQCADEIYRVLNIEGTVGVWVPSVLVRRDVDQWGHLRAYSLRELQDLFKYLELVYAAPNRSWGGNRYYESIIQRMVCIFSVLPWQRTKEYKDLNKKFLVNKSEYVLYLFEKYIDRLILKHMPELAVCIIAIFKKT
jgi:ubiquinone/menaquinone biosynthesis C-methylase UbiE